MAFQEWDRAAQVVNKSAERGAPDYIYSIIGWRPPNSRIGRIKVIEESVFHIIKIK